MKLKYFFVLILITFLTASCGPIQRVGKVVAPPSPGERLFESAEKEFRNQSYNEALSLYRQYLDQYPDTSLTPAAMMKVGLIFYELKNYEKSRNAYLELKKKYSATDFARRAEVEILYTYFQEGQYQKVLKYADEIQQNQIPSDAFLRFLFVTGDTQMALGEYPKAYVTFLKAFESTPVDQRSPVEERLAAAITYLDPEYIKEALKELDGNPPAGYLMYQLGVNSMANGRIGDALAAFSDFINRFPEHPYADLARQHIATLQSSTYFEAHRVGCLLPLSGQYETFGNRALQAIELALDEFGRHGGIEPPVELIVRDTGGDPEKARQAVAELNEKKVSAIIGPMITAPAAAEAAQNFGIPIITLTQKPGIVEIGDYVFRNFMTPEMQVKALIDYTSMLGLHRFAVLYPDEAYGNTFLQLFRNKLQASNGMITVAEKYNPKSSDFSGPIKRIAAHRFSGIRPQAGISGTPDQQNIDNAKEKSESNFDFDAIFIPDSPQKAGLIIPQLQFNDINNIYLLGTNLWHSKVLVDYARDQLRYAVIPDGFFAASLDPRVRRFVDQFAEIFERQPEFIEAVSYDTAMMVFDLISRPDIMNRESLRDALHTMPPYEGVTGKTKFSETGEAEKTLYLLKVEGKQFLEIER